MLVITTKLYIMTNQKLLDKMAQEGYYQTNVIRITRMFLEDGFYVSKIYKDFIILKREDSEALELLKCFSSACEFVVHSMDGTTLSVVLTQLSIVQFVD